MISAIISDIHGNLPALELLLKKTKFVERYISLGDVVNYGPWSNECVELLETLKIIKIKGNHDEYFINKKINSENKLLNDFFNHSFKNFNNFDKLIQYKDSHFEEGVFYTHTLENQYIYQDTNIDYEHNLFIGHTHRQFFYKKNNKFLANPGSVGQNRSNINKIEYIIFDSDIKNVELKFIEFDINVIINEMVLKSYPQQCIEYYLSKIND